MPQPPGHWNPPPQAASWTSPSPPVAGWTPPAVTRPALDDILSFRLSELEHEARRYRRAARALEDGLGDRSPSRFGHRARRCGCGSRSVARSSSRSPPPRRRSSRNDDTTSPVSRATEPRRQSRPPAKRPTPTPPASPERPQRRRTHLPAAGPSTPLDLRAAAAPPHQTTPPLLVAAPTPTTAGPLRSHPATTLSPPSNPGLPLSALPPALSLASSIPQPAATAAAAGLSVQAGAAPPGFHWALLPSVAGPPPLPPPLVQPFFGGHPATHPATWNLLPRATQPTLWLPPQGPAPHLVAPPPPPPPPPPSPTPPPQLVHEPPPAPLLRQQARHSPKHQ